jgi:hypothetical protein
MCGDMIPVRVYVWGYDTGMSGDMIPVHGYVLEYDTGTCAIPECRGI